MSFCTNCGAQISQDSRYCGKCGTSAFMPAQQTQIVKSPEISQPSFSQPQTPYRQEISSAPAQPGNVNGEVIQGVIPLRQLKSLGRYDSYVGVITNQRLILARLTNDIIKDSVTRARNEAKAQGKGFMGQVSSQMKEFYSGYTNRYLNMTPSAILSESPGNFGLNNHEISEIRMRRKDSKQGQVSGADEEFEVDIFSGGNRHEFRMEERGEFVSLLRTVYGERVRTPFGYFNHTLKLKL